MTQITKEGQKFANWTVITPNIPGNATANHSIVTCECGNSSKVHNRDLYSGRSQSCGSRHCITRQRITLKDIFIGTKFGHMTVLEILGAYKEGKDQFPVMRVKCKCDCGEEKIVRANNLRGGHTTTCGCRSWVHIISTEDVKKLYKIDTKTGCWNWINTKNRRPRTTRYAGISMSPRRAVYQILVEEVTLARFRIAASCKNPTCVNPKHTIITSLPGIATNAAIMKQKRQKVDIEKLMKGWGTK